MSRPFRTGGFCPWWALTWGFTPGCHIAGHRSLRNHVLPPRRIAAELDALAAELDALNRLQAEIAAELNTLLPAILIRNFREENK